MDQALNSQKTPHTSPLRASYGMSFVSILMKNDRVIKGFYCTITHYGVYAKWSASGAPCVMLCHILQRYSTTGTLVPDKSTGAPQKTTSRQDCALFKMVRQDRFISVRDLTAWMRNLYGFRAGWKAIKNRLLSRGYHAYRPTRKPLLTSNHRRLRLEWAQRWQTLTMANWQHFIFDDESRFQLYLVDDRLRLHRLRFHQRLQAYTVQAGGSSVPAWGAFHSGAKWHLVRPDRYLTGELYMGHTSPCSGSPWFPSAGHCHQDGAACKIARL